MFPKEYFGRRYFPPRYWPVVVAVPVSTGAPEAVFLAPARTEAGPARNRKSVYQVPQAGSIASTNRFDTVYTPAPRGAVFLVEE